MMAVVMAGGRATRFDGRVEKALLEVGGKTLLMRSIEALELDGISEIAVAVSPHTPGTRRAAEAFGVSVIDTRGHGYHEDVTQIMEEQDVFLTLNVDVPFVTKDHVARLLEAHEGGSIAAIVDASNVHDGIDDGAVATGTKGERFAWVGLNIVTSDPETKTLLLDDAMLLVNINDEDDLVRANAMALERGI